MRELVDVAERMRDVRAARQRFLWRGHFEEVFMGPELLAQVAADVERVPLGLLGAWDAAPGTIDFPDQLVDEP